MSLLVLAVVLAQATPIPPVTADALDISAYAKLILDAVHAGNWALVASLSVVVITWAARKYGAKFWPFIATDAGGALSTILLGVSGAMASALAAGAAPSPALMVKGIEVGLAAAGGYATVRKMLKQFWPKLFTGAAPVPALAVPDANGAPSVPSAPTDAPKP